MRDREAIDKELPAKAGRPVRKRKWVRVAVALMIGFVVAGVVAGVGCLVEYRKAEEARLEEERRETERIEQEGAERARLELERQQREERLRNGKLVALTFDDGPSGTTTPGLLDILREKKAVATFFVIGNKAKSWPDLVRRELAEGHEVGSHTTAHVNFSKVKSAAAVVSEMAAMRQIFTEVTGAAPTLMRPPYGNGIKSAVVTQNVGLPMIHWSVDTLDWKYRDPASVRQRAMAGVYDGAIILMHDIHPTTVAAVGAIIDDLRTAGYELVTVSEMARLRGVSLEAGKTYFYFKP